jgi:ornithine carbamoyltransferase
MKKDFISMKDLSIDEINELFELTRKIKKNPLDFKSTLSNKSVVLIFEKPSNRTRVSFEVGIWQLGGQSIYLGQGEINLGVREAIKDVAKTLSRYCAAIVLRTFSHKILQEMAEFATIPVINGLTDLSHPCQALSDIYTLTEKFSSLDNKTIAYIGDGNNVCNSLIYICAKMGINLNIATPKRFEPENNVVAETKNLSIISKANIQLFYSPQEAVKNVDVIYTDVWASMGKEREAAKRKKIFKNFQINSQLLAGASRNCLIMHCLPAHRGQEITDEVLDSKNSIVFDQAENRLHVQKAILIKLLKGK